MINGLPPLCHWSYSLSLRHGQVKLPYAGLFSGRIREVISVCQSKKPAYGLLLGVISTILFQSSSATTLLTVSIVSAGLISFFHSLGILLEQTSAQLSPHSSLYGR